MTSSDATPEACGSLFCALERGHGGAHQSSLSGATWTDADTLVKRCSAVWPGEWRAAGAGVELPLDERGLDTVTVRRADGAFRLSVTVHVDDGELAPALHALAGAFHAPRGQSKIVRGPSVALASLMVAGDGDSTDLTFEQLTRAAAMASLLGDPMTCYCTGAELITEAADRVAIPGAPTLRAAGLVSESRLLVAAKDLTRAARLWCAAWVMPRATADELVDVVDGRRTVSVVAPQTNVCQPLDTPITVFQVGPRTNLRLEGHRCASANCPGLPWRASDQRHPCTDDPVETARRIVELLPDTAQREEALRRLSRPWGPRQVEPGVSIRLATAATPEVLALTLASIRACHALEVGPDHTLAECVAVARAAAEAA